MTMIHRITLLALSLSWAAAAPAAGHESLVDTVRAAEAAFAQTMADRDFAAFQDHVAEEAVFISGPNHDRGRAAVAARWAPFFEGEEAPFSWQPELVAVLDSGRLALSSGPVFNPQGERTATFTSTWRLDEDGRWRVVFDKGERHCPPP